MASKERFTLRDLKQFRRAYGLNKASWTHWNHVTNFEKEPHLWVSWWLWDVSGAGAWWKHVFLLLPSLSLLWSPDIPAQTCAEFAHLAEGVYLFLQEKISWAWEGWHAGRYSGQCCIPHLRQDVFVPAAESPGATLTSSKVISGMSRKNFEKSDCDMLPFIFVPNSCWWGLQSKMIAMLKKQWLILGAGADNAHSIKQTLISSSCHLQKPTKWLYCYEVNGKVSHKDILFLNFYLCKYHWQFQVCCCSKYF